MQAVGWRGALNLGAVRALSMRKLAQLVDTRAIKINACTALHLTVHVATHLNAGFHPAEIQ